jgi:hypothetical protein
MHRFSQAFAVLASFAALACSKEPAAGDSCKPTDIRCVDPKTELACQKGVFIVTPCKGPMGCREEANKHLICDATGNAEGDPCSTDEEGAAQCIGDKRRITCREGRYVIDECRGAEGCKGGGAVKCDQSKGEPGDPCRGETNSCSMDSKRVLTCNAGKLQISAECPGEGGCSIADHKIDCDLGKKDDPKKKKNVVP